MTQGPLLPLIHTDILEKAMCRAIEETWSYWPPEARLLVATHIAGGTTTRVSTAKAAVDEYGRKWACMHRSSINPQE